MPITPIKAPDGSIIKVQHPDGASMAEIGNAAEIIYNNRQSQVAGRQDRLDSIAKSDPSEYDPTSDAYKKKYGAASGSFLDNFLAGSGKAFVDLGRGAKQLAVEGADLIPGVDLTDKASELRAQQTENRALDSDLMSSAGGLAGNIGTNVGLALTPGGLARGGTSLLARGAGAFSNPLTYGSAAASGAVQGALQPVAEDELRSFNTGAGATFGAVGKALTAPFSRTTNAASRRAIERLESAGIPLDVAERTQSGAAKRFAAMLDDSVITAGPRESLKQNQLRAFTRAALESIGENADEATESVMLNARTRIGGAFDDFAKNTPLKADQTFYNRMAQVYDDAQGSMLGDEFELFDSNFRNVLGSVDNGTINGSRFSAMMRRLGSISGRPDIGHHAKAMEDVLLDALEASNPEQKAAIKIAREQWRNLRTLQGTINKGEERFISPLRLSNALSTKKNQNLSVFGLGGGTTKGLSDLARAGREILGEFGNSGTALRQQGPTTALLAGAGTVGGLPGLLAAGGGLRGAGAAFNSQGLLGNILTDGLPPATAAPIKQALISKGLMTQEEQLQ